ncbi:hypothetical protein [Halorarum halobium]|uniref:hypothetical protein n=1 Tax=Halorarum halobium TaxID=3075121 RepID=UPI0028AFDD3C|nr:hypothetical protein [Halobaculum sp. XH14]
MSEDSTVEARGDTAGRAGPSPSRWAATLLLALVGLGLAWSHWLGLVAGAALVSLPQRTLARGVAAGLAFGALAALANAFVVASAGPAALETYLSMGQAFAVSVAIPLVAGLAGGLFGGLSAGVRG